VIYLWWEILKNAKLSGKATGTSLDASKIKINIDEGKCKEKLIQYSANARRLNKPSVFKTSTVDMHKKNRKRNWQNLPEEVACKVIKKIDEYFVMFPEVIEGLFLEPNFHSLNVKMNFEQINIDGYVLERKISAHLVERKRIHINYILYEKGGDEMVWYIHSICWEEAGDLSESELDWRK